MILALLGPIHACNDHKGNQVRMLLTTHRHLSNSYNNSNSKVIHHMDLVIAALLIPNHHRHNRHNFNSSILRVLLQTRN